MTGARSRLSGTDWTDAALRAMATQGTAGINVEQLARDLGTTKGSFYHHFDNRQALLGAALSRWEEIVEQDLSDTAVVGDARERLIKASTVGVDSGLDGFVDLALASSIDEPAVAATLRRVHEHRMEWLTSLLAELGVPGSLRQERALGGLAAYLGLYQLQRVTGERMSARQLRRHITHIIDSMTAT